MPALPAVAVNKALQIASVIELSRDCHEAGDRLEWPKPIEALKEDDFRSKQLLERRRAPSPFQGEVKLR
jgi:hypothetical protein